MNEKKVAFLNVRNGHHWVLADQFGDQGYSVRDPNEYSTLYEYSRVS